MTAEPYSVEVRRLFKNPQHVGDIPGRLRVSIEAQGVRIRLSAALVDDRIEKLRFLAWGCPHVIAAAEAVCARYEGGTLAEIVAFTAIGVMQTLAVPVEKTGRILVLEDAVQSLGRAGRESS